MLPQGDREAGKSQRSTSIDVASGAPRVALSLSNGSTSGSRFVQSMPDEATEPRRHRHRLDQQRNEPPLIAAMSREPGDPAGTGSSDIYAWVTLVWSRSTA